MIKIKPQVLLLVLLLAGVVLSLYSADADWQMQANVLRDSVILIWMVSLFNMLVGNGLGRLLGIRPRQPLGLLGIPFSPLVHRDLGHLIANTVPLLVLGWLILVSGELGGDSDFYGVTIIILLIGGLGTWLFGRNAIHLGASGIIFGYIGFLLISGYTGPTILTISFALIVFLIYGDQLRSMLPIAQAKEISWEGHLFGFAGGIVAGTRPDLLTTVGEALDRLGQSL
ncbi:MAG: rhomboid family intramembrane serine protease [Phormidesmis sp.]